VLRDFQIDQQLELGRLLNRKVGGLGTFKYFVDKIAMRSGLFGRDRDDPFSRR
jgi:hypothetical protein